MWFVCAGYTSMSERYPEIEGSSDNTVRNEGTAAHWAAHRMGEGEWVPVGEVAPNGVEITEELHEGALTFLNELETWGVPAQQELTLPSKYIHEECGGTSDAFGYDPDRPRPLIRIGDFKMGYRVVDPFENLQMIIYLCGIIDYLGIDAHTEQFVDVEFSIIQPRAFGRMGGPVTYWRTAVILLRPMFNRLIAAAAATLKPDAPLTAGTHCLDCSARYACPALHKAAATVLDIIAAQIPHELDAPALGVTLTMVDYAATIIESLQSGLQVQAQHMMARGSIIPGYIMQPTVGRLTWNENVDAEAIAIAQLLNINIVKPQQLITPTQAKALKFPEEILKQLADRKQSGMKLTRIRENAIRKLFEG